MGLRNILRAAKNSLVATGLSAIVSLGANAGEERNLVEKRSEAVYGYHVGSHITTGSAMVGGSREQKVIPVRDDYGGKPRKPEDNVTIESVGKKFEIPSGTIDFKEMYKLQEGLSLDYRLLVSIDRERGHLVFEYLAPPIKEDKRLPSDKRFYTEDSSNTHVYFVLPKDVSLKALSQTVSGFNHNTERAMNLFAFPIESEDSDLGNALRLFNAAMSIGKKPETNKTELETAVDNLVDRIPGGTGKVVGGILDVTEYVLRRREEKRRRDLEERFSGDQVIPMPFHSPNGNPLGYTVVGRRTKLFLDPKTLKGKARIVVPNLSFVRDMNGTIEIGNLEGLGYEIELGEPEGGLPEDSSRDESKRRIVPQTYEDILQRSEEELSGVWVDVRSLSRRKEASNDKTSLDLKQGLDSQIYFRRGSDNGVGELRYIPKGPVSVFALSPEDNCYYYQTSFKPDSKSMSAGSEVLMKFLPVSDNVLGINLKQNSSKDDKRVPLTWQLFFRVDDSGNLVGERKATTKDLVEKLKGSWSKKDGSKDVYVHEDGTIYLDDRTSFEDSNMVLLGKLYQRVDDTYLLEPSFGKGGLWSAFPGFDSNGNFIVSVFDKDSAFFSDSRVPDLTTGPFMRGSKESPLVIGRDGYEYKK